MVNSVKPTNRQYTAMNWPICPDGFYDTVMRCWRDYGKPIIVTENGAAFDDVVTADGQINDEKRIMFLKSHLAELNRVISDGAQVLGYMVWSSFDNFEWALGYNKRFGLVYIDYKNQNRIMKDSGKWYSEVIRNNGFEM